MTLDLLADGQKVFIDANVFIYHFSGVSPACSRFLTRCEAGALDGVTSVQVVLEVLHRLMMLEAVMKGLVFPGGVAAKLKRRPELIRELHGYAAHALRIPEMGVRVLPSNMDDCRRSQRVRDEYGLMTNDSMVLAAMETAGCVNLASADADFDRVSGITVYKPGDV